MPAAKKRTEVLVGLFLLIGFAMLSGLILQFGKFSDRLRGQYPLTVVFDDASGVIKGSEVRMGGAKIGQVADLPELNDSVQVEVRLAIRNAIRIPSGATFQINSATLLGDKLIVIVPPVDKDNGFIAPGTRLTGGGPTGLDALQNNAETLSKDVVRILKQAEETLAKVDGASKELGEAVGKINRSVLADKNLAHLETTLANLATTTEDWKTASAKLDPALAEAREAIQAIRNAAANAEKTLKSADQAIAEAKPALKKLPKAVDELASTTAKAGEALDRMKKGEGLLGALATDNDVALDAKAFMRNLRRYGVFRYRDAPAKEDPAAEKTPFRFESRNR